MSQVWTDDKAFGPKGDMRMVLSPAQALETHQECINPTDTIAGLIRVTRSFRQLPAEVLAKVPAAERSMVDKLSVMLPALPVESGEEGYYLKYGEYCSRLGNVENTALYAVPPLYRSIHIYIHTHTHTYIYVCIALVVSS